MLAQIAQGDSVAGLLTGERRGRSGHEHLPAVRDVRDPRCAMNVDADVVRARLATRRGALARVHAHAHADDGLVWEARRRERALRRCRRADRGNRIVENQEQRVALDTHLSACGERDAERPGMSFEHLVITVGAEGVQKLRRALDVGEQEGQRAARQTAVVHLSIVRS